VRPAEEQEARRVMLTAAIQYLESLEEEASLELRSAREDITRHYQQRLSTISSDKSKEDKSLSKELKHSRWLTQELRKIERASLQQLHAEDKINDSVLRTLERELDLLDARFVKRQA
jgi:CPA1 family monovalent cation:H+ antiporter